jgi:hypothetical protein
VILIDDTLWPLVVVGVCRGAAVDPLTQRAARVRWRSPDPRLVTLVVPGVGIQAVDSHSRLVRWLKRHVSWSTPVSGSAWVIPDAAVRTTVNTLLNVYGGCAFGAPSSAFGTASEAIRWLCAMSRVDQDLPRRI